MHPRLRNLLLTTAALIALGSAGTASGKTGGRRRSQSRGEDKKLSSQVLIFCRMALTLRYRHWRFGGRPPRAGTLTMRANSARLVRNGRLWRLFLKLPNLSVRMLPEATALVEKQDPSRFTHGALQIPSRKTTPAPRTLSGLHLAPSLGRFDGVDAIHLEWVTPRMGSMR